MAAPRHRQITDFPQPISGYPQLADRMGLFPETAIFKRFSDLSARNLLYLQAELIHKHLNLRELEEEEFNKKHKESGQEMGIRYAGDWFELYESRPEANKESTQWHYILEIRAKLKEYEKALLRAHAIAALENPDPSDLENLQNYLNNDTMRTHLGAALYGADSKVWGYSNNKATRRCHDTDLTAVRTRKMEDVDLFTRLVMTKLIQPFSYYIGRHFKKADPIRGLYYEDESMRNFARCVTTFLATVILLASINALYFISSMVVRLGAISAFTIVFALCLLLFAKSRPIEIFSTTSAFLAVQVVFISTIGNNSAVAT